MSSGSPMVSELDALLAALPQARIGVVGDFCLDFYQFVDSSASEVSIETGLATLPVREVRYSLGGAGNVVNNLCAMGARQVRCYGVVGDDPHGQRLVELLREAGAGTAGMLVEGTRWLTQTYTKVIVNEDEAPRIDWGNFNHLSRRLRERLLGLIGDELGELDLIVINQQVLSGIHTPEFRKGLAALLSRGATPALADSRHHSDEFDGSLRKLNEHEAARLCRAAAPERPPHAPEGERTQRDAEQPCVTEDEGEEMATLLFERWRAPVLLTRGERGCLVRDARGSCVIPGIFTPSRIDPVGAGDSMLAGTAAALAAGRDIREAARLGNLVAAITVQKLNQTGTASAEEIRSFARTASYRFRPELAATPERARFFGATRLEIVSSPPRGRTFAHALFDNDGTLSTLRQGWEEVMEPMMVRSILGPSYGRVEGRPLRTVVERVREYIDRTTGVQTIEQMAGLVEMVKETGYVEARSVLDAAGYKRLYNAELMRIVEERLGQLERGELEPEDFLMKGSVAFAAELAARGIVVHLASGTDHDDLQREAAALGFASLFGAAIHGSVGDAANDPKRVVLESILEEIGDGSVVVTFGDGPVELRETVRRGGYAVGVASNEARRFGLNISKRARLIEAGADLIVPDFSQRAQLERLLWGEV